MDPKTVVLVLAMNLIANGALLALIGARMAERSGLRGFSLGAVVFGLAYLVRLAQDPTSTSLFHVLPDAAMIFATLCFVTGLRRFNGESPLGHRLIGGGVALFVVLSLVATWQLQAAGRHLVLNVGLAATYGLLGWQAARSATGASPARRLPLRVLAAFISLLAAACALRGAVVLPLGVEALFSGPAAQLFYGYSIITSVVLGPNLLWMVFLRLNEQLARLATHDPLTKLLNRNGLADALHRHFEQPGPRPLVLMHIDIDHFKRINDEHGHAAGDAVLQGVAHALGSQLRASDFVARLGGEEFLVGCDGPDVEQAAHLAERLRMAVAERRHRLPGGSGALGCTISVGVSPPVARHHQWEEALRHADEALYAAKQAGRNRVRRAAETPLTLGAQPAGTGATANTPPQTGGLS